MPEGELAGEPLLTPQTTVCPRCGGFKPVTAGRWRTLCAECHAVAAHSIESLSFSAGNVIRATARLWAENAAWMLPLAIVGSLPQVAARWLVPRHQWWIELACTCAVGTLVECITLLILVRRTFSRTNTPISELLWDRYLTVLVINVGSNFAVALGALGFLVGSFAVSNLCQLMIPLALFDGRTVHLAIRESFATSIPRFWTLLPATIVFSVPGVVISTLVTIGALGATAAPQYSGLFNVARLVAPAVQQAFNTLPQVLQFVVWYFLVVQVKPQPAPQVPDSIEPASQTVSRSDG